MKLITSNKDKVCVLRHVSVAVEQPTAAVRQLHRGSLSVIGNTEGGLSGSGESSVFDDISFQSCSSHL